MHQVKFAARMLVALTMVAGVLAIGAGQQAQAVTKYARITFHTATCPENTGDVFGKCHNRRLSGADFTVYNPTGNGTTKTTNSNGEVSFGPRAGSNAIVGEEIDSYVGAYVYCSVQNGGAVLFDGRADDSVVWLNTARGDLIICDWYYLT
jgi:hypothetical protein